MSQNPVDYIWVSNVYGVYPDPTVKFQLSQRADHILKTVASRVRFNRALINPKWETMYAHEGMTRLHLLFGREQPERVRLRPSKSGRRCSSSAPLRTRSSAPRSSSVSPS